MSYQIQYHLPHSPAPASAGRPWLLTLLCFGAFLCLVKVCWPEGQALLRRLVLPNQMHLLIMIPFHGTFR